MKNRRLAILFCAAALAACSPDRDNAAPASIDEMAEDEAGAEREAVFDAPVAASRDEFTYANYDEVRVANAEFDLTADFDAKIFSGTVILDLEYEDLDAKRLILDTDDLTISTVEGWNADAWSSMEFTLGDDDPNLGAPLEIQLDEKPNRIRIT